MFGCLRRIGCLILILAALLVAWYWYAKVDETPPKGTVARRSIWEPVTPTGAERGRSALESLSSNSGPNFVNLSAGDIASYIFFAVANRLPDSARDIEAAIIGNQLVVRGVVSLREMGAEKVMGPLASLLSDSDTIRFGGTLNVVQSGLGEYRVQELRLQSLRVPSGLIPRILRQFDTADRPLELPPNSLALPLPPHIQDIRVGDGVVTLYKQVQ